MIWSNYGKKSYFMSPHRHDMHEFFVCLNNHGRQHIEGQSCDFKRGMAFMLYSECQHQLEFSPSDLSEFIFVCFDKNHLAQAGYLKLQERLEAGRKKRYFFSGDDPDYLEFNVKTISLLHQEISSGGLLRDELINALLVQLLVNFFRNNNWGSAVSAESDLRMARVKKLCHRVTMDSSIEMTLDQAAQKTGMSRCVFAALVKETTGLTWREYVLDCRLKKAIELLGTTDLQISDVALQCDFNNIGYFHRSFSNKFGNTPARMRIVLKQNRSPQLLKEF